MPRIAALLTCFNRQPLTLQCLQQLIAQQGRDSYSLSIYMVDDGCSDGTADAVKAQFPEVHILQGNGSLFWNGGMRLAWQAALENTYDFYLWINDDTVIYPDAITRLLTDYQTLIDLGEKPGAITGTMIDPSTQTPTYGGKRINSAFNHLQVKLVKPSAKPEPCDFINGNLALIPATSVKAIGILNQAYKHGYGDYDYSCRLRKAGFSCWVGTGIYGECIINTRYHTLDRKTSIADRLKKTKDLERLFPYQDHMYFVRHCSGQFWPIWWLKAWLRGHFPLLWVLTTRIPD